MKKIYIQWDIEAGWIVYEDPRMAFEGMSVVELTEEEWADYNRVELEAEDWQVKLEALDKQYKTSQLEAKYGVFPGKWNTA